MCLSVNGGGGGVPPDQVQSRGGYLLSRFCLGEGVPWTGPEGTPDTTREYPPNRTRGTPPPPDTTRQSVNQSEHWKFSNIVKNLRSCEILQKSISIETCPRTKLFTTALLKTSNSNGSRISKGGEANRGMF